MRLNSIGNYWDTRAEGYYLSINDELNGESAIFWGEVLSKFAPADGIMKCLDAGCGPGFFSTLLARQGHSVYAVDYSEGMLEKARNNFDIQGVSVGLFRGDVQNLPFADCSFDYIVSRNLIWNLEEPEKAYAEWSRLLKPGGNLLVADANHYLHYYDEDYYKAMQTWAAPSHKYILGVDTGPINEIARNLPLSKEKRPEWDVNTLIEVGFDRLNTIVKRKHWVNPVSGDEKDLVFDFIICAGKP